MKIAIDLDDTTVNSKKYYNKQFKKYLRKNKLKNIENIEEIKQKFINDNLTDIHQNAKPIKKAIKYIKKLKEEGYEIHFVTARLLKYPNNNENEEEITITWLKKYDLPTDNVIYNKYAEEKAKYCLDNNIYILIDDNFKNIIPAKENGIDVILYDEDKTTYEAKYKKTSWKEVYNYIKTKYY